MDALSLIPQAFQEHPSFWLGSLSAALGEVARMPEKEAQRYCRSKVAEFIASPVPSEELREALRGYLR